MAIISFHVMLMQSFVAFSELKRILKEKLAQEIPVITVVAVMGTTEESAVDPVTAVVDLREKFRRKVWINNLKISVNYYYNINSVLPGCDLLRSAPASVGSRGSNQSVMLSSSSSSSFQHGNTSIKTD